MKISFNILLIVLSTLLLNSCASVKNTTVSNIKTKRTSSPIDTVFIDFNPSPINTKLQVFRATKDGRSGWMNVEGDWIVSPEYDPEFKRGWAEGVNICLKGGKYGAINYKNEIVIPFEYAYPPADCSDGLILVKDSLDQEAYFSKKGIKMTDFKKRQPVFRNGFAIVRSNRKELAHYPRIDLENSKQTTQIHSGDFVVINTKFDTILQFKNVPFLLDFGTLNNNRRTFFLYPYMGLHADIGLSYGQYGYLDGNGDIVIEPKFRASDVFIPIMGGFVRDPDCPFNSNLSMVRELEKYYYIDTLGNNVFELQTNRERIYDVSYPNNCGLVGYRTFGEKPNTSMIHVANKTGTILHEAFESDAPMSIGGAIGNSPGNDFIPILDKKNGFLRIYTSCFEEISSLELKDTILGASYRYEGFNNLSVSKGFTIIQTRSTPPKSYNHVNYKRLIDGNGQAKSSWFPLKSILSNTYGNFSFLDTINMTNSLYDSGKKELFKCDSCYFDYYNKMRFDGVYKVVLSNGNQVYLNFKGEVLNEFFDSMEENIFDITDQATTYNNNVQVTINAQEQEFEKLFKESIMHKRIIK